MIIIKGYSNDQGVNRLKLRTKTLITVLLFSLLIFAALQAVTFCILKPSFTNIENQETIQKVNQAITILNYTISDMAVKVADYSWWDDSYSFAQNKNSNYLSTNFVDSTFQNLNLNLVMIVNNQNNLLYCQSFDTQEGANVTTAQETINNLVSDSKIWQFQSLGQTNSGLITIEGKPMLIASAPILTSNLQGPAMGGMVFGRYLDKQEITQLTKLVDFDFSLTTISEFKSLQENIQVANSLLSNHSFAIKEVSSEAISGYTILNDVHSTPMFVLEITQDRTVYQQSVLVVNVFLVATIAIAGFFGLFLHFLLRREIVKPMSKLAASVEEISVDPESALAIAPEHFSEEVVVVTNAVRDTLMKKLEGMNEVSRMVAHDLRNPLSGIRNATFILKKRYSSAMSENDLSLLQTIDDCVVYSDGIVQNLLEYSSEIKLDKIYVDPKKLIDSILSKSVIPNNINLINGVNDDLSVRVDPTKIERVFTNIITNGVDALQKGGALIITSKKTKDFVQIDFSDTGIGISKKDIEKIWVPFYTTKAKGMGIGLSICKRLVDAHGGKILVQSTEGKGTCFSIFLPTEQKYEN
jgi:signal transduction histidine kinase